jgi:hypothetical protein
VFQETPIYVRLVTERGDVPSEVRREAEQIHRDLARYITPAQQPNPPAQYRPAMQ